MVDPFSSPAWGKGRFGLRFCDSEDGLTQNLRVHNFKSLIIATKTYVHVFQHPHIAIAQINPSTCVESHMLTAKYGLQGK